MIYGRRYKWKRWIVSIIALIALYLYITSFQFNSYDEKCLEKLSCHELQEFQKELVEWNDIVHDALERVGVSHFLIYGAIWGHLRGYKKPCPWDHDVDLGTVDPLWYPNKFLLVWKELNQQTGVLPVVDKFAQSGLIQFQRSSKVQGCPVSVDVDFFYETWYGRTTRRGWEPSLLPFHYHLHHSFPSYLLRPPLQTVPFGGRKIAVPSGNMTIMRHLYRYNWFKVARPQFMRKCEEK